MIPNQQYYKFKIKFIIQLKLTPRNLFDQINCYVMNHSYHLYPQPTYEDHRIKKLKQDNLELQKSLAQLNECYQEKVNLLEAELKKSKQRQESLLQWKSKYIQAQLFKNQKYEQQLQKMIKMMEEMSANYEHQNSTLKQQLTDKEEEINHLRDQTTYLRQQRDIQDEKVQSLAKKYIFEIQRLNNELKELKQQVNYEDLIDSNNFSVEDSQENQHYHKEQEQLKRGLQFIEQNPLQLQNQEAYSAQSSKEGDGALKDISNHATNKCSEDGSINSKINIVSDPSFILF